MGRKKIDPSLKKSNQLPLRFSDEDYERIQNMLWATGRSYQGFAERAIIEAVEQIEKEEHHGRPFKQRPTPPEE